MDVKELRINNLIKNVNSICKVVGIMPNGDLFVDTEFEDWNPNVKDCEGIPLTEEWLLKFGLNKTQFGMTVLSNNGWGILIEKSDVNDSWNVSARDEYIISVIDYVHQLQNLYFALTNQELEIKS